MQFIELDDNSGNVFVFVIGFIVAIGVLNTVLMSVMERMREFGVMLAVGMGRRRLFSLVVLEGILLGVGATALGVALGLLATWPCMTWGIDYGSLMGGETIEVEGLALKTVIYASPNWTLTWSYAAASVFMTVVAALYPAIKASRLQPVDAMRHI